MRITKPLTQSLLHRKFDYDKKSYVSVVSAVLFDFKTQKLCSEQDLWKLFGETCLTEFDVEVLDLIGRKKGPEVIVNGYAYGKYAKDGKTTVKLQLNNVSKNLDVWGDRYWINGTPSRPVPFDKIAINWKNAYGGSDYPKNPKGKGRDTVMVEELNETLRLVPNIESPADPIQRETKAYEPVTFTALPTEYPERNKLMGSYDDKWRQEEFPGLAKDVDWAYFNQAPSDQRLTSLKPGDEAVFVHMHPEKATCRLTIPAMKHKVFVRLVQDRDKTENFLHPIDLELTTLWAFPHLEQAFLIYEGVFEISRWFFVDDIVSELMGAIEHPERPKSLSKYEEIFKLRTDENLSMHYASMDKQLVDEEFLPKSERLPVGHALKHKMKRLAIDLKPLEDEYHANQEKIKALRSDGIEVEEFDPKALLQEVFGPEVTCLDEVSQWLEKGIDLEAANQKQIEEERNEKSMCAQMRELKRDLKQSSEKRSDSPRKMTRAEFIQAQKTQEEFVKESQAEYTLEQAQYVLDELRQDKAFSNVFRDYTAEDLLAFQRRGDLIPQAKFRLLGEEQNFSDYSSEPYPLFDANQHKKNAFLEKAKTEVYKIPNELFNREESQATVAIDSFDFFLCDSDELYSGSTFVLSNKKSEGRRFEDAVIFDAQTSGCQFTGCSFKDAVLTGCEFSNCVFTSCEFVSTEMQGCFFIDCQFINCEFTMSEINKTGLTAINFENCVLDKADFDICTLSQVQFKDCTINMSDYTRTRLWDVSWHRCDIKQQGFTMGMLKKISFYQSQIESAAFVVNSWIRQLRFVECELSKLFIKAKTRIQALVIMQCKDKESSWRELTVEQALISDSQLENDDFSKTHFSRAKFTKTSFKDSLWMSSIVDNALLDHVDYAEAVLMGIKSINSHFKRVSFFTAELSYADIDQQTTFVDCHMARANTVPNLRG